MKKPEPPSRQAVKLDLPPLGRAKYTVELGENMELIVSCPVDLELCAGRVASNQYRIWTRVKHTKRTP